MKLVIAEYLRSLKERDELDRLLPDLLIEMGFTPIAKPQMGNRQFGVDLAVRGNNLNPHDCEELVLLVIKQGDLGRREWDSAGPQAVRPSINEIFDVYLKSHVEPQDASKPVRIIVATGGELEQTIQAAWSGFCADNSNRATFDFWGADRIAGLIETYLLNEFLLLAEDKKDMRRALALSSDADYDRKDLHRIFLRALDLTQDGSLINGEVKKGKTLVKAIRAVNLAARMFASWSIEDGDARLGILGIERALLWTFHRIQLADESDRTVAIAEAYAPIWIGYLNSASRYCGKVYQHFLVEDSLIRSQSNGPELSFIAFEQIGLLSSMALARLLIRIDDEGLRTKHQEIATRLARTLIAFENNNGICSSPCLDRHSQDITLAMMLLVFTNHNEEARAWLRKLVRNIDYAFKAKRYVPICTDSLDDLVENGGWLGEATEDRLMHSSWMLPTLAGWAALLGDDVAYDVIYSGSKNDYPKACLQLWHPDGNVFSHMFFRASNNGRMALSHANALGIREVANR
jgi:hypothetical protein